ncbi:hypothetical protein EON66_06595 [archaeon]|nr:MAG: hypothetical protein EON66_06595 [archaeon]
MCRRREAITKRKLDDPLYYGDYLCLKSILGSQHPRSAEGGEEAHDEHLFIVVHQVYELWFKQILHEIDSVRRIFMAMPVDERNVGVAVKRLQRVREIQTVLLQQISVLETMSPIDFLDFRDFLYPASGFQSAQFRLVENKLGLAASTRMTYGHRGYCTYLHGEDSDLVKASGTLLPACAHEVVSPVRSRAHARTRARAGVTTLSFISRGLRTSCVQRKSRRCTTWWSAGWSARPSWRLARSTGGSTTKRP